MTSIEFADRGLPIAERLDLSSVLVDGFNNKGSSLAFLGRPREATALLEAAVGVAQRAGSLPRQLRARNNFASIFLGREPRTCPRPLALEGYHLAERLASADPHMDLGQITAGMYLAARDWDMILAKTADALATEPSDAGEAQTLATRNAILTARGERDEHALPRLFELDHALSDKAVTAALHMVRADAAELEGQYGAARDLILTASGFEGHVSTYLGTALHPAIWAGDPRALRASSSDTTPRTTP